MNTVAIYNINVAKYRLIVKKGNKNQKKMRNIKLVPTYSMIRCTAVEKNL